MKANLPDSILIWKIKIKIIVECCSILILSELRSWSPKVESAPESKNPDTFKFLSEFSLCSRTELAQLWGASGGLSYPVPCEQQVCSWAGCPASKLWEIFFSYFLGLWEERGGGEAWGLPWHVGRCHLPAWLWTSHKTLRLLALWMASLLRSTLHQCEGL